MLVTDANGDTASASVYVSVLNVHCGPTYVGRERNTTVSVSLGGVVLCISPAQVPAKINDGYCLGPNN